MAFFGNILRRVAGRLREQEAGPADLQSRSGEAELGAIRAEGVEFAQAADHEPPPDPSRFGGSPRDIGGPATPTGDPQSDEFMESPPAGATGRDGGLAAVAAPAETPADHVSVADDDALLEDPLISNCPYCGTRGQKIGSRCERCSRVIVRLPGWAQHRRRNWLVRRLSWRRIIVAAVIALFIVFAVWVNYPFAPNPLILAKNIQSHMTADTDAGVWTVSGRDLRNSRYVAIGFPPPSGTIEWRSFIPEPLGSEPVAQHSNIYVGSANGIYSLAEHDGQIREGWDGNTPGRVTSAAAVVDSYLFFGSTDHTVNSWNALTGDAWWSFPAEDTVEAPPKVWSGLVFISSGKGWLYGLDANNGSLIWQTQLDSNSRTGVALYDGRLFVGDDKGIFYILSARTGQEWFRFRTLKTIGGPPVISSDGTRAYFVSSGQLYAVSAEEREIPGLYQFKKVWAQLWLWQVPAVPRPPGQQGGLWRFRPENPLRGIYSSPALAEGENGIGEILYAGAHDHTMYALDAVDGTVLWTFEAEDSIIASPIVIKDRLIFGDEDGNIYSLDRFDGTPDWKIFVGSPINIPPTISNQLLIVRAADGHIYGIK